MQRYTFQLSIGGSRIMSTKETIDLENSPKTKKSGSKKVPNDDIIKAENEPNLQSVSKSDKEGKIVKEVIKMENEKNIEPDGEKKPKGITKEIEEEIMSNYKNVSDDYKKLLINFFKAADVDNVGFLTIHRFAPAVRKLGYNGTDRALAKMFIDINTNFDGEVTIQEFMTEMTKKDPRKMSEQELTSIFRKFDSNKDGFITKDELEKTMDKNKMQRTNLLVTGIMRSADFDGDGKISLEEFRKSCQYKDGSVLV